MVTETHPSRAERAITLAPATTDKTNEFGQPVGPDLGSWVAPERPSPTPRHGRTVRLDPLAASIHAEPLTSAFNESPDELWTYLPWGPYSDSPNAEGDVASMIDTLVGLPHWQSYAVVVDDQPLGMASYLRINPSSGSIEIGGICFSAALQRTTAATEALSLLIGHSFELGYRRCEWKCDALNGPSRRAAERLGFSYEGTFRKATHYKGRSRDTAWFAIIDDEWPPLGARLAAWLSPDNFDRDGNQLDRLTDLDNVASVDVASIEQDDGDHEHKTG